MDDLENCRVVKKKKRKFFLFKMAGDDGRPDLIFVLAGQSNMAGRGDLGLAEHPNANVLMLSGEDGQVAAQTLLARNSNRQTPIH